jgi:hypothetical protein
MRRRGLFLFFSALTSVLVAHGEALAQQDVQPPPPIAPPPPMTAPGPGAPGQPATTQEQMQQAETNQRLDEAEKKDTGRKFELFWLDGQIGGSYINMKQFSSETFAIENASAGGPMFAVGAGVRLVVFVAGARLRHHALSSFNMWQINGEAGLKAPIGKLDILIQLHGGYSFVGRLGDAGAGTASGTPASSDAVSIRGFNAGLEVGLDYYVSPLFSVGVGAMGDFLLLNRPPADLPPGLTAEQQAAIKSEPLYGATGTSAGLMVAGGLRLGLHFGL